MSDQNLKRDDPRTASNFERGAADADIEITRDRPGETDEFDKGDISGGVGASDGSSGGGAGAGLPDGDTDMRTDGAFAGGDVEEDKKKLFPEASESQGRTSDAKTEDLPPPKSI